MTSTRFFLYLAAILASLVFIILIGNQEQLGASAARIRSTWRSPTNDACDDDDEEDYDDDTGIDDPGFIVPTGHPRPWLPGIKQKYGFSSTDKSTRRPKGHARPWWGDKQTKKPSKELIGEGDDECGVEREKNGVKIITLCDKDGASRGDGESALDAASSEDLMNGGRGYTGWFSTWLRRPDRGNVVSNRDRPNPYPFREPFRTARDFFTASDYTNSDVWDRVGRR